MHDASIYESMHILGFCTVMVARYCAYECINNSWYSDIDSINEEVIKYSMCVHIYTYIYRYMYVYMI
jgi:hypothetical protein